MEASSLSSCIAHSNRTLFPDKPFTRRRITTSKNKLVVNSMKESDSQGYEGKLVDESLIILRMRIKEVKMMEKSSSQGTTVPSNWMEWEKQYYCKHYHEDVCQGIGWLQMYLMNTRPSLALVCAYINIHGYFQCFRDRCKSEVSVWILPSLIMILIIMFFGSSLLAYQNSLHLLFCSYTLTSHTAVSHLVLFSCRLNIRNQPVHIQFSFCMNILAFESCRFLHTTLLIRFYLN